TPPDGQKPRMQMYLWNTTVPGRDGDLDNGVIAHEYGHGISNRLTGGPANASALTNIQSRGMGEGWSDWWGSMFTQKPGDTAGGGYVQAAWVSGNPASGPGDRRFPYSFDKLIGPLTFEAYGTSGSVTYDTVTGPQVVNRSTQVHATGEIWASALWDMNWLLIDKYGFDKDLSTGYAPGNGPSSAGNKLAMQLVMDGLKLQPVNPSFTEARDAILAADFDLTGGQNQREIWTAFARRGLGAAAFTNNSGDTSVSTDFNVPPSLSRPGVIGVTPAARTIGGAAPTGVTFKFSEPMNTGSFDTISDVITFSGPGAVDLRGSITGFTWNPNPATSNDNTELRINFTPPTGTAAQGNYSLRLGSGIVSADNQASPLDQNIDGNAGTVADQFVANFRYDLRPLTALLTSSPSPADPSLPGSIIAVFNEPIDPLSVSVEDLQVSEGTVVLATPIRSNPNDINSPVLTVRYDLAGVTVAPLFVTIKYGAITDPFGFPVEEANAQFGRLVIPATPFPTPLASYGPLGWEAFGGQVTGNLIDFGQIDSYSIELDAGQSLSVVADQLTSLRAQVRLFDPSGTPIALATGAVQGDPVSVGPVVAPAPGRYVMQITGPSSSVGPYRLRALLGAVVENETSNPSVTNDAQFGAESLNGLLTTQGGPGSTLRSVTVAGNVGTARPGSTPGPFGNPDDTSDYYSFTVTAGQRTSVGMTRAAGGSTLTLTVTDGFGAPVPLDLPNPGNFDRSATFTPTANGTYRVQVSNTNVSSRGTDYALAVVLNGVLDRESNNSPLTAQALQSLNTNVRGGLTASDQDWYSFTLFATTDVYLTSLTPGDGPNQPDNFLNPMIELYDLAGSNMIPLGAPLFADDNGAGDGKNALVVADDLPGSAAGITYRFRVRPSTATPFTTSGEYIVKLDTTPNPGPVNPSTGGPYTVAEGQDLVLNGTVTDSNGDP
ncbi:MAG TPA: M36 family metallopeptidase, partial [Urbifossiella sp.]|nr:M36 family metallopeptidase [Urbifossiella sp.]